MIDPSIGWQLSPEQARVLEVQAAKVFQPRTPITTRDLFAGRWGQITTLADAVGQPGLHVVIYGERGVGKTSLANVVRPIIRAFDDAQKVAPVRLERLVIKTNANSEDTFSTIWHKLFQDLTWSDNRPTMGLVPGQKGQITIRQAFALGDVLTVDDVRKVVSRIPGSVYIIDEFDRAAERASKNFTDLMKAFSDFTVECTVMLVGVSETVRECVLRNVSASAGNPSRGQTGDMAHCSSRTERPQLPAECFR
jgi:Cdc6-like AAA superfamily ATPase